MKKIALIVPWFGPFRNDFYFWLKSVEYNPTVDFLFFTDQTISTPPNNLKVINTTLKQIENLAKKNIWEGCILSKPYKICDYKVAYGEMFIDYLKEYDFWGHCDVDMIFGNIRKFITEEVLNQYDRIEVDGPFTLYRNTNYVNNIYRQVGDIKRIFTEQRPFGFDECGLHQDGTGPYWIKNFPDRLWCGKVFDNLEPYHYSFVSRQVRNTGIDIRNLMFTFNKGKLYCYGTLNGKVICRESLYVHIQKRPIIIRTNANSQFSLVPPGKFTPFIENVSYCYLKWHIRDNKCWAYYIRIRNKMNSFLGRPPYSNLVLTPKDNDYDGIYEKPFYRDFFNFTGIKK